MANYSKNIKDLNISKILLINYLGEVVDITSLFVQMNIYESIFSTCITGDIIINDGTNLLNNFPIICQEKICISFSNPSFKNKTLYFNVTHVTDIKNSVNNDKVQNYILHFTSKEFLKNKMSYISRCLKGKADDVIFDILTKDWGLSYKEGYKIEKSDSYINFIPPYWSPFEIINYISNRSIPENRTHPTYLFYQDFDNYNFISYDSLLEGEVKEKFHYMPENLPVSFDIDEKSKNINRYDICKYPNLINMLDSNMLANQYLEVDLINKKYNTNKFDYVKDFENIPSLYNNAVVPVNNLDNFKYEDACGMNVLYNFPFDKDYKKYNKWFLYRKSWMQQIQSLKIKLETTENTDRRVGDLVEFNIPSRERVDNHMKYAEYITGKYIISKIRHTIGSNSMGTSTLELIKDSFSTKLPEVKNNG